jgi:hypothetical protein
MFAVAGLGSKQLTFYKTGLYIGVRSMSKEKSQCGGIGEATVHYVIEKAREVGLWINIDNVAAVSYSCDSETGTETYYILSQRWVFVIYIHKDGSVTYIVRSVCD